jgi:hypothetical protein
MSIVEDIVASIESEVVGAGSWTIVPYHRVWRKPDGKRLDVFMEITLEGDFRTTESVEESHVIVLEYSEPANTPTVLERDEAGELAADDVAHSLRAWARDHQSLPESGVHRLDHTETRYVSGLPREALVRYCQVRLAARTTATYG